MKWPRISILPKGTLPCVSLGVRLLVSLTIYHQKLWTKLIGHQLFVTSFLVQTRTCTYSDVTTSSFNSGTLKWINWLVILCASNRFVAVCFVWPPGKNGSWVTNVGVDGFEGSIRQFLYQGKDACGTIFVMLVVFSANMSVNREPPTSYESKKDWSQAITTWAKAFSSNMSPKSSTSLYSRSAM